MPSSKTAIPGAHRRRAWQTVVGALLFLTESAIAGDIPGMPVIQPPSLAGDIELQFGNDFLSFISNRDDFRTQQTSLTAWIADDWLLSLDQSFLTLRPQDNAPPPEQDGGRLDQLSASVAYRPYGARDRSAGAFDQVLIGAGLRRYGNLDGQKIQNGFHRLFDAGFLFVPYVSTERTDAVVWIRGSRERFLATADSAVRLGYWLDGTALLTSDGQSDGTAGAYGMMDYRAIRLWFGLRGDWRTGYDRDFVQRATAENETGTFAVAGVALGPITFETLEGLGNSGNGYGRLVLAAYDDLDHSLRRTHSRLGYQLAILSPEAAVQNQFRWSPRAFNSGAANGRGYTLILDYRYATPSPNELVPEFVISQQVILGAEIEFFGGRVSWFNPYVMLGAGYRSEYLEGQRALEGMRSDKVESAVGVVDAGVRFNMAGKQDRWLLQLQLGVTGWLPFNGKAVVFNNEERTLLQSDTSFTAGVTAAIRF